ncbi:FUSC family protein [Streptomyces orinoci]|uniref:FUSC family protein n=1 Tax=Streptomyces orinoci TaxID=67339 RepID=A0ABV3JRU5_STRON|nr:FUSC family protein [Streptomyces orinoci]
MAKPLPLRGLLRLNPPADIWHKPAFSAALAMAVPELTLLLLGRLDLALYTAAGALCALYGHDRPYRARARLVGGVVLAAVAGVGLALTCAALVPSPALRVALAALVAAAHKTGCDAAGVGPPGNIVLTFVTSTAFFVPQRPGEVPAHLALVVLSGLLAWLVCMAPGLVRPYGPERIATARALEAAARLRGAGTDGQARARHAVITAVGAARRTIAGSALREALRPLVAEAERALADGAADPAAAESLRTRARVLRRGGPVPPSRVTVPAEPEMPRPSAPLSPSAGVRVALGGCAAGWTALALGFGHPYWAVVTAASVCQAHTALSWQRGVQRVLGNLLGLAVFTALLPLARTGAVALVLITLALQVAAEATIACNYWLGTVWVTPMALFLGEFAAAHPARHLAADRWLDTVVGAVLGLAACVLVTNRRAARRAERAVTRLRTVADEPGSRHQLAGALVELREAVEVATGEWWVTAPAEAAAVEREAHARLTRLLGSPS